VVGVLTVLGAARYISDLWLASLGNVLLRVSCERSLEAITR
jgi:hypothetical protein